MLVIEGLSREEIKAGEVKEFLEMTIPEHVAYYMDKGMDKKDAMKQAARDRGVGKREIYQEYHK